MQRDPKGADKDQIRAVASGEADIAIVNSYYLGVMANSGDKVDEEIAKEVKVFFLHKKLQVLIYKYLRCWYYKICSK